MTTVKHWYHIQMLIYSPRVNHAVYYHTIGGKERYIVYYMINNKRKQKLCQSAEEARAYLDTLLAELR